MYSPSLNLFNSSNRISHGVRLTLIAHLNPKSFKLCMRAWVKLVCNPCWSLRYSVRCRFTNPPSPGLCEYFSGTSTSPCLSLYLRSSLIQFSQEPFASRRDHCEQEKRHVRNYASVCTIQINGLIVSLTLNSNSFNAFTLSSVIQLLCPLIFLRY